MFQASAAASGAKPDRSLSPNTMSEEDRRELIARQHRALYGDGASLYEAGSSGSRPQSQDVRGPSSGRGASPLAFDPYSSQPQQGGEGAVQMPPRDPTGSTASPVTGGPGQQFGLLSESQQPPRTSESSPRTSPPLSAGSKGGVAPIGTRPAQAPTSAAAANKRSTTPMTPSGLSYGFSAEMQNAVTKAEERSTSAASNPPLADKGVAGLGSWGGNSNVWGAGKGLAVQPSVWG